MVMLERIRINIHRGLDSLTVTALAFMVLGLGLTGGVAMFFPKGVISHGLGPLLLHLLTQPSDVLS